MDGLQDIDFEAVAFQAPVAWSILHLDGHQLTGNQAYADLFGYELADMAALHVTDLSLPEVSDRTHTYLDALIRGAVNRHETDKRYVRADGSTFVGRLVASLLRDAHGAPTALIGVITDVTAERALAERVARSEERLSKMLTNISDTVTLVDAEGVVSATSGTHRETLGYTATFWSSRSVFDVLHPDDRDRSNAMTDEITRAPGVEVTSEFRVLHHDGHYEDVEVTAVNLLHDPAVEAVVLTTRNITTRKTDQRELVEMRDQAVRIAEQRINFVAHVSHELRTPLHAVLGLSEILADSDLSSDQLRLLDGVRFEATRLSKTVDDLLDHVRVEADGMSLEVADVDVRRLVAELIRRAEAVAESGLDITWQVSDDVPGQISVDRYRLDQILTNLVGNAVKFTGAGTVHVTVEVQDDRHVRFLISDSGPGIPDDQRTAIFEPFAQVPGAARAVGGSGLGLALVRGLTALMGGSVRLVDSYEGATFEVLLPLVPSVASSEHLAAVPAVPPRVEPFQASVLVVEDNCMNQMLVSEQLTRLGHRFQIAETAIRGLELLAEPFHGFDVVLMDWQLPDIDGLEATRRLRAMEMDVGRHVPVVAFTASAMPEDRLACRDAGMDDFLPKPASLAALAATLDRCVPDDESGNMVATTEGRSSAFDRQQLDQLEEELDSRDIVASLVERFLGDLDARCDQLVAAHLANDLDGVHRSSHTLRSTSEMVGARALSIVCRQLENTAGIDGVDLLVSTFSASADAARVALLDWLSAEPQVRP